MSLPAHLTPDKALIFRITHRDNVPWILRNGLWCRNAQNQHPDFITIGNAELIEGRRHHQVPIPPGGVLADYVSFYFTPYSPMLLNIITGMGVPQRDKAELVVLVSSLHNAAETDRPFVFTDRHAYLRRAHFSATLDDLATMVPWNLLQARDFSKDSENPEKSECYQAEALVYEHLPVAALRGIVTYNEDVAATMRAHAADCGLKLDIRTLPGWFF